MVATLKIIVEIDKMPRFGISPAVTQDLDMINDNWYIKEINNLKNVLDRLEFKFITQSTLIVHSITGTVLAIQAKASNCHLGRAFT